MLCVFCGRSNRARRRGWRCLATLLSLLLPGSGLVSGAGVAPAPEDPLGTVVAAVRERLAQTGAPTGSWPPTVAAVEALLTTDERSALATAYLRFAVDRPVRVSVFVDTRLLAVGEPFWLQDLGFAPTDGSARAFQQDFVAWQRDWPAGEIGLGIHAFRRIREHYFVTIASAEGEQPPVVEPLGPHPPHLARMGVGALPWRDRTATIETVSPQFVGQVLLQTASDRRPLASLIDYFRLTDHPATAQPDQIVLTLTADPARAMAVQWRTSTEVGEGKVRYWPEARPDDQRIIIANRLRIEAPRVLNQRAVLRHTAVLTDLAPGQRYGYCVGHDAEGGWSPVAAFATAPAENAEITFLAFGDVQEGYEQFADLLASARRIAPHAAFAVFAGDLVSRGNDLDDWDAFFAAWAPSGMSLPMAPAVGNHELLPGDHAELYRQLFHLPTNGPATLPPERTYRLDYAGHRFLVLDSNTDAGQTLWLQRELSACDVPSTFAVAHHGAYTSRPGRYYARVREKWAPLLIHHRVGLVFQGHDHAYLRTIPMYPDSGDKTDGGGTTFLISTAGDKYYAQAVHDYAARAFADTATFSVITADPRHGAWELRTFDAAGKLRDQHRSPGR